jgi:hypothetical protein
MNSHNNSRKTIMPIFKSTRLLVQLWEQIRYLHYSLRDEEAFGFGARKLMCFHHRRHLHDVKCELAGTFAEYLVQIKRREDVFRAL